MGRLKLGNFWVFVQLFIGLRGPKISCTKTKHFLTWDFLLAKKCNCNRQPFSHSRPDDDWIECPPTAESSSFSSSFFEGLWRSQSIATHTHPRAYTHTADNRASIGSVLGYSVVACWHLRLADRFGCKLTALITLIAQVIMGNSGDV